MKTILATAVLLLAAGAAEAQDYYDRGGQTSVAIRGVLSHGCPTNYAMGGINFGGDGNTFACRYVGPIVEETVNTVQREGMLACQYGFFMTALNIERNYARCSRTWSPVSPTWLTTGNDSSAVAECQGSNWAQGGVMVGFHKERKVMLCATVARR
jgi:hypothetical protein